MAVGDYPNISLSDPYQIPLTQEPTKTPDEVFKDVQKLMKDLNGPLTVSDLDDPNQAYTWFSEDITVKDHTEVPKPKAEMNRLRQFRRTLEAVALVLAHGERKHGDDLGWRTISIEKDLDAVGRHFFETPYVDIDSGQSHLVNLICRAMFAHEKWLDKKEQYSV